MCPRNDALVPEGVDYRQVILVQLDSHCLLNIYTESVDVMVYRNSQN
jgi:hypothetical protein